MIDEYDPHWAGKQVIKYQRRRGTTGVPGMPWKQVPTYQVFFRLKRRKGEPWRVVFEGYIEVPLDTEDLEEAKAAAMAIWRLR